MSGAGDENRISFHCVGLFPNGNIWNLSLDPELIIHEKNLWTQFNDFEIRSLLIWMCINAVDESDPDAPAKLVGIIRSQREGQDIQNYHTYLSTDIRYEGEYIPTDEEILAMQNGLLYVVAAQRNPSNPKREAERIAEDARVLDQLGIGGE